MDSRTLVFIAEGDRTNVVAFTNYIPLRGCRNFRRLFERVTDGCKVEINPTDQPINPTGTRLQYKPGVVIGGKNHVHDCDVGQAISYYLEPLIDCSGAFRE